MTKPYTRKLSTTEVKEACILILKNKVKYFPEPGKRFTMRIGGKEFTTQVVQTSCTCQGPEYPHFHWHLDASGFIGLLKGSRPEVSICKVEEGIYELEVQ
jgi:hypothetical protein